ncbi:MAG: folylpolyglutamate synthase/dihydrofolate synthase family protein [Aureispira sp.]
MDYNATLAYLYDQLPMFQRVGKYAFKKTLDNIQALCAALNHPQQQFKSVHIAGTNGKGSTTHILAAILQTAGYRVGVYSSPHYKDFRERVKINGVYIEQQEVVNFVAQNKPLFEQLQPSFFEMTVAMAFDHFARHQVDIALIETGLGGRLDSTNVVAPLLSVITNIGYDHQAQLGHTLALIAGEKAGIIKPNTPVIIGETHPETTEVFVNKAQQEQAPIVFADQVLQLQLKKQQPQHCVYQVASKDYDLNFEALALDLQGSYQIHNLRTALLAAICLRDLGYSATHQQIKKACTQVQAISGLMGRWQVLGQAPLILCDSAHNVDGLRYVSKALADLPAEQLHIVFGTVSDKDWSKLWGLLPQQAQYYFCKANIPRGLNAQKLQQQAVQHQLHGTAYASVQAAFEAAKAQAQENDVIFVGGSIFVVAEVL